jgi:hypothetical protein
MMIPPEQSVMREIERAKPVAELRELSDRNDRSVLALGGFWARVCTAVDPSICIPDLIRDLKDSDPQVKAFACENLGILKPPSAVTPLKEALKDTEIVPAYAGSPEVAVLAAQALVSFGYADGIEVMLAHAEREGSDWSLSYKKSFGQLSGEKFPKDLRVWRRWFQEHRSTLKYAP